jgi:hypothetical protein
MSGGLPPPEPLDTTRTDFRRHVYPLPPALRSGGGGHSRREAT